MAVAGYSETFVTLYQITLLHKRGWHIDSALACVLEFLDSNFNRDTTYPELGISWFSSVPSDKTFGSSSSTRTRFVSSNTSQLICPSFCILQAWRLKTDLRNTNRTWRHVRYLRLSLHPSVKAGHEPHIA